MRNILVLCACVSGMAVTSTARADPTRNAAHFEGTMGFLTQRSSYAAMPFTADDRATPLTATFARPPLDGVQGYGLRYDLRLVVTHLRMTVGFDMPFADLGTPLTAREGDHETSLRALHAWGLRFGLGGEYAFGPVVPFADLMGTVHLVDATVAVDNVERGYQSKQFGFTARAGARVHLRPWFFVAASGEVGVVGPTVWGADLSVGFAL